MKKLLTILVVALIATATVFADVSFSGSATVGYKFNFDGYATVYGNDNDTADLSLAVTTDYFKVALRDILGTNEGGGGLNSLDVKAQITLYLDKALADAGLELPVALTGYAGNASVSGFYAYSDPTGTIDDNFDGFSSKYNNRNHYPVGLDVGYQNYVTVRGIYDFYQGTDGYMFSAKSTPVEGVDVALSFTNYPAEICHDAVVADYGLNISAKADIAKLAGLDFNLDASAMAFIGMGDGYDSANNLYFAAVTGGYQDIGAYVEYVYNDYENGVALAHGINIGGSYNGIENLSLGAGIALRDLSDVSVDTFGYNISAAYTLGTVTYKAVFLDVNHKPGFKLQMSLDF